MQSNCLYSDISPKVCKINFGLLLMKESISEIGKEKKNYSQIEPKFYSLTTGTRIMHVLDSSDKLGHSSNDN